MAGRTPVLQHNWQSSEKSQHFKEKNTIFIEHPVITGMINNFYNTPEHFFIPYLTDLMSLVFEPLLTVFLDKGLAPRPETPSSNDVSRQRRSD